MVPAPNPQDYQNNTPAQATSLDLQNSTQTDTIGVTPQAINSGPGYDFFADRLRTDFFMSKAGLAHYKLHDCGLWRSIAHTAQVHGSKVLQEVDSMLRSSPGCPMLNCERHTIGTFDTVTAIAKGKVSFRGRTTAIVYLNKARVFSLQQWCKGFTEIAILLHPRYLQPLQGDVIPLVLDVHIGFGRINLALKAPDAIRWFRASNKMSDALKARVVRAYQKIHARGVVHGSVKLKNMLISTDGRVTLLDFSNGRSVDPNGIVGPAAAEDLVREMDKVKKTLFYDEYKHLQYRDLSLAAGKRMSRYVPEDWESMADLEHPVVYTVPQVDENGGPVIHHIRPFAAHSHPPPLTVSQSPSSEPSQGRILDNQRRKIIHTPPDDTSSDMATAAVAAPALVSCISQPSQKQSKHAPKRVVMPLPFSRPIQPSPKEKQRPEMPPPPLPNKILKNVQGQHRPARQARPENVRRVHFVDQATLPTPSPPRAATSSFQPIIPPSRDSTSSFSFSLPTFSFGSRAATPFPSFGEREQPSGPPSRLHNASLAGVRISHPLPLNTPLRTNYSSRRVATTARAITSFTIQGLPGRRTRRSATRTCGGATVAARPSSSANQGTTKAPPTVKAEADVDHRSHPQGTKRARVSEEMVQAEVQRRKKRKVGHGLPPPRKVWFEQEVQDAMRREEVALVRNNFTSTGLRNSGRTSRPAPKCRRSGCADIRHGHTHNEADPSHLSPDALMREISDIDEAMEVESILSDDVPELEARAQKTGWLWCLFNLAR
ncbi:hypothetical protein BXZ70DRAFT_598988 [Cristinia sonorae]|uniref:Protein kinase domain-containing protein n=1 Tax=Cristinia sonorae TaxID=1940300 RepID=A0A8K0UVG0_9AGAR|nr:hypothetical protein BXZ70DRAFT_598988 [Cristinia sonorae]